MKLYVGNLSFRTTQKELQNLFEEFGGRNLKVNEARSKEDRLGRSFSDSRL